MGSRFLQDLQPYCFQPLHRKTILISSVEDFTEITMNHTPFTLKPQQKNVINVTNLHFTTSQVLDILRVW